jgi:hypothetical protein
MYCLTQLPHLQIRDFTVFGNYPNRRSLVSSTNLHSPNHGRMLPTIPGYSPPIVEFEAEGPRGRKTGSIAARDIDLPLLCHDDLEKAKGHLALILRASQGDRQAEQALSSTVQEQLGRSDRPPASPEPAESRFVVPSTSNEAHSEQAISHKGFNLLRLSQLGYPVPDFVILTSDAYAQRAQHLDKHVSDAVRQLEILTTQGLGDLQDPLVFAMRCAIPCYVPGVMRTYLNVGVTEGTLPSLEKIYGTAAAHKMFLNNLKNLCVSLDPEGSAATVSAIKSHLPPQEVARLIERLSDFVAKTDRALVADSSSQALFFVRQAYKHFDDNRDLLTTLSRGAEHYPCVIMQKMICTVRHDEAYAGVLFSRHCQTGVGVQLNTARNIFGEEIMTGTTAIEETVFEEREAIRGTFPAVYQFVPHLVGLEKEFESPVTIEFAVEAAKRYQWFALLQLNETGMAGRAALISAVDMHKSGAISRKRVTELIRPYHIKQLESDTIDPDAFDIMDSFCSGVAVLPRSAVSARIYFTEEAALRAKMQGEKVSFCKKAFLPTDTAVMREMDAIMSLSAAAIHVVTICQSIGIPALLNLEKDGVSLQPDGRLVNRLGREIKEGDWITISSRRQALYQGKAKFKAARFLRYMKGEPARMNEDEKKIFASIAYAYRYYHQLIRGLRLEQISTLNELIRLVNLELRGESEQARQLVNGWFDEHEALYVEELLKSDMGDHLSQNTVFDMLTPDRKISFFRRAIAKCSREGISGYKAGAFMLGRFLALPHRVSFWKSFSPLETGFLVNEWILFEKYMQLLHNMGERRVLRARKKILEEGLDELFLHPGNVKCLVPLKLSGIPLDEVRNSLPGWSDPQSARVLELLQQPYRAFYDFEAKWSVEQLEKICREEKLPLPRPDDA